MFEEADNFADIFRGGLPYYLLITLPILIICSSNPVLASSEFAVQRMSQYDVHGISYGCRASAINLEAKSLYTWSTSRHCVVTRLQDMTIDQFREIRAKAGGLVVLLPENFSSLSLESKQHFFLLEQAMMAQVSSIPIYFSPYNKELNQIIEDITINANTNSKSHVRESALSELVNSISANGYQVVISGANHNPNKQSKIPIIQGELAPFKNTKVGDVDVNSKLPLIILVAHLNTFGLYNDYLSNSDVGVLLSIAELFSRLHNTRNSAPKYRVMFLVSESGSLLNFQGMKKWLDENLQLQNVDFVMCLDTITPPYATELDSLYMHVSKPPKEGTPMSNFYKYLKNVAGKNGNLTVEGVHKKINLADVLLAWEHERFSMKRMPAFTVSSLKSHKEHIRTTIFKEESPAVYENVKRTAKILAEALAEYVFSIEDGEIFAGNSDVNKDLVQSWMQVSSALHNNDLKNGFEKFLKNVKVSYEKPDSREPDFMLYEGHKATLNVYRVKPAVFDLFLTLIIAAYLGTIYFVILYFPHFYTLVCKMSKSSNKVKVN